MILVFWARWRWRIFDVLIPLLFVLLCGFSLVLSSNYPCMSHDIYLDKQHEARDAISLNNITVRTLAYTP
jgi:hypothetical protein